MAIELSRRELLRDATLVGGLTALGGVWSEMPARASRSPNEKLNIGCIGVGGQGAGDIGNFVSENIVALCDVDDRSAAGSYNRFPKAEKYRDFRKLLERKDIDAVSVSTPDHIHGPAAAMALRLGKHVYCQKPLTHSIYEARVLARLAKEHRVATQMGTQGHAFEGNIRAVELLKAGAIGSVSEVHVVTDRPVGWWPQGMADYPKDTPPTPAELDWNLWLGPARPRPYHPSYLPFVWRGWWDFGTGSLGDMACHLMDVAFWALGLRDPTTVFAYCDKVSPVSPPLQSIITWQFPERNGRPPVKMVWYDGGNTPSIEGLGAHRIDPGFNGSVFVGEKGLMLLSHGADPLLLPESRFKGHKEPPKTLPRPADHYRQWLDACKKGTPTGSNFMYAGPFTEAVLLGNVAMRVGDQIEWDPATMRVIGVPEADRYIKPQFRMGWEV